MPKLPSFIIKSEFSKHVSTLLIGQLIVHAFTFLALPLITHFYPAENIGAYSFFMALFMVFTTLGTGRYESAIIVEESNKEAVNLWSLASIMSVLSSFLLLIFLLFFYEESLELLKVNQLGVYILWLPLTVFLGALIRNTQFYFNKHKDYKTITLSDIVKSGSNSIGAILLGWLKVVTGGLILANLVAHFIALIWLLITLPQHFFHLIKEVSFSALKKIGKKYQNYLTLYTLSGALSAILTNGTPLFIIFFFTEKTAGYYFMAEKVVGLPIGLVVAAISKVFYQRATEMYREDKSAFMQFTRNIQQKMFWVLLPALTLLSLVAPYLFELLGTEWKQAGEMIKYFAILVLFNNIVSPVASIANIINRLDILLYFNVAAVIIRGLSFYVGSIFFTFEIALLISALSLSLCYLLLDLSLKYQIKKLISVL